MFKISYRDITAASDEEYEKESQAIQSVVNITSPEEMRQVFDKTHALGDDVFIGPVYSNLRENFWDRMIYALLSKNLNVPSNMLAEALYHYLDNTDEDGYRGALYNPNLLDEAILSIQEKYEKFYHHDLIQFLKKLKDAGVPISRLNKLYEKMIRQYDRGTRIPFSAENISRMHVDPEEVEVWGEDGLSQDFYKLLLKRQEYLYKYQILGQRKNRYGLSDTANMRYLQIKAELEQINKKLTVLLHGQIKSWLTNIGARLKESDFEKEDHGEKGTIININFSIVKALENAKTMDEDNLAIERAINAIHTSDDPMLGTASVLLLDYLSNIDTTAWDKDLERYASVNYEKLIRSRLRKIKR